MKTWKPANGVPVKSWCEDLETGAGDQAEKRKAIHDGADAVSDNMSTVLGKRKR